MERAVLDALLERAAGFGTPAYVYLTDLVAARLAELRAAFGRRFALSYAAKCNPNPELLRWLKDRIEHVDVSSIGELRLAQRAGWDPSRASFTGPGKRAFEIGEAIEAGVGELVLENLREAVLADLAAGQAGRVQNVLLRIAPERVPRGFGDQMAGRPVAFGIDIEDVDAAIPAILAMPNLKVTGLHIYSGTQCLNPAAICENYRVFLEIFREVCTRFALRPQRLVFGSGLGIPYHEGDAPVDLAIVAAGVAGVLADLEREPLLAEAQPVLELGRYLVGEAGYFLTRAVAIKTSRGTRIAICDGGMNNHLPASGKFGMVIHRNYLMHKVGGGGPLERLDLVGPLCTSIDRLANGVMLPRIEEGDLVAIHASGAYGLTASPLHFISHAPPQEIIVEGDAMRQATRDLGDIGPASPGGA